MELGPEIKACLWTLHIRGDSTKVLYVACLLSVDLGLGDRTESASLALDELNAKERAAVDHVFAECIDSFPPPPRERVIRGVALRSSSVLHITHAFEWPGLASPSELVLAREVVDGPDTGTRSASVALEALSSTARTATASLDSLATATGRRLVDVVIARMSGQTAPDAAPAVRRRVFISYRFGDRGLAQQLYDAFSAYGSRAFFTPYMDAHDLPAGELRKRLQQALTESDIFIALATTSYAPADSWSRAEVEMALDSRVPIIPVLIAEERPAEWLDWKHHVTHRFAHVDEIAPASRAFAELADLCLRTPERPAPLASEIPDEVVKAIESGRVSVLLRLESIELSAREFAKGDLVRVFVRANGSPVPITQVRVCYARVGIGAFRACPEMRLTSGTAQDGEWSGSFRLDRDWPAGEWVLQDATIANGLGYGSSVDPADWGRQGGGGSGFKVR